MTRHLMDAVKTRNYLIQQYGIKQNQNTVAEWMRKGRILPVQSQPWSPGHKRFTTKQQIDAAVAEGRVPPPMGRTTSKDHCRQVMVQIMDAFGGTLAED